MAFPASAALWRMAFSQWLWPSYSWPSFHYILLPTSDVVLTTFSDVTSIQYYSFDDYSFNVAFNVGNVLLMIFS